MGYSRNCRHIPKPLRHGSTISYKSPAGSRTWLASKKGIVVTATILGLVTAASFAIWIIPQQGPATLIVVTDRAAHLDGIDDQRRAMADAISAQLTSVIDGSVSPQDHIESARESSVIVKRQIAELLRSGVDEPWRQSYQLYVESLRLLDSYIGETVVIAELIEEGRDPGTPTRADAALAASEASAAESAAARPRA